MRGDLKAKVQAQPRWRIAAAAIIAAAVLLGGAVTAFAAAPTKGLTYSLDASLSSPQKLSKASVPAGVVYISVGSANSNATAVLYVDDPYGAKNPYAQGSLAAGIPVDLSAMQPNTKHSILVTVTNPSGTTVDLYARFTVAAAAGTAAPAQPTAPGAGTGTATTPAPTGGDAPMEGLPERDLFTAAMVGTGQTVSGDPGSANPGPGDIVEIPAGSYEPFTPKSGSNGAYVTYRAAPGTVTINGMMKMDGVSWVHLDGLTLTGSDSFALELTGSQNVALTNIEIDGSPDGGMRIYDVQGLYVEGANIHGTNSKGTSAASEALSLEQVSNFELLNNRVHGNGEEGIDVKYGCDDGTVHHNAAWENRGPNIYVDGASNVDVHHNYAWGATSGDKPGIMLAAESEWSDGNISNIKIRNNTVWGNGNGQGITLWEGNFSGIEVTDNVFADGDSVPEGGNATYSGNTSGSVPDVSKIVGSVGGSATGGGGGGAAGGGATGGGNAGGGNDDEEDE